MRVITLFFTAILLMVNTIVVNSQNRTKPLRVAIIDPSLPGNNDPALQIGVREIISACFVNYGHEYSIVERSQLDKIMAEAKFNNSDAVDESQATELGRLAGADRVVLSVISRMGSRSLISIKMINVETASVEKQQSKLVETESLLDVIEPITLVILGEKKDVSVNTPKTNMTKTIVSKGTVEFQGKTNDGQNGTIDLKSVVCELPAQPAEFLPYELYPVYKAGVVNVEYDISEATVEGMPLEYSVKSKYSDKANPMQFFEDRLKKILVTAFINNVNDKTKLVKLTYGNETSPVKLVIKIRLMSNKGNECVCDYIFVDVATNKVISGIRMKTSEGVFGSFTNLLGDVFREAGEKFGGKLNDALKKASKM